MCDLFAVSRQGQRSCCPLYYLCRRERAGSGLVQGVGAKAWQLTQQIALGDDTDHLIVAIHHWQPLIALPGINCNASAMGACSATVITVRVIASEAFVSDPHGT